MTIRFMQPQDWRPVPLEARRYSNPRPLTGFQLREKSLSSILHPASEPDTFEQTLREIFATVQQTYPGLALSRQFVKMPHWHGPHRRVLRPPTAADYHFMDAPERLTTTAITIVLVPRQQIQQASLGFYFEGKNLPSLRQRLHGGTFQGIVGNLGYFMTHNLVLESHLPWAHNTRYPPAMHLSPLKSYLGFHLFRDAAGAVSSGFQGARAAAVGVRASGEIDILPRLDISAYHIQLGAHTLTVNTINAPDAVEAEVVLFTPGLWTPEVAAHTATWQTYAPRIPLPDVNERVNIFITNEGNGQVPIEKVVKVWAGQAPLPAFGGMLSMKRAYFERLFGSVSNFEQQYVNQPVYIQSVGATDFDAYTHILGGLMPAVVDRQHVYCAPTMEEVLANMQRYGNARSPIAHVGQESQNFDLFIREPAGVLVQTPNHIGWALFDGRHELSIGASVMDVAVLLNKLQLAGAFLGDIEQAVFIDGGSAMKAYAVDSARDPAQLSLLNRVAAGGRNPAGDDPDGLNLYTLLNLGMRA